MFLVGQDNLKDVLDYIGEKLRNPETGDVVSTEYRWIQERFACLSSGLAYIHEQGVLHQDIKPSNIIHRDDRVYFTDFSSYSRFTLGQTTSTESPARTSLMHGAPEVVHSVLADGSLQRH
ncbi:hypothetical protein M501DRAFT_954304 [Patellaria atrata CBS 101060]|uniref:Protein kinase domain-containing protein n=1 Tax=Patellaria atrata CBS 101060 TaxID=1346257 RepID=A0A9P4SCJ8_9PEZI|nr:hypothetical protein M501DRAFT_954304 [Patellaria atrata CBS 101060]